MSRLNGLAARIGVKGARVCPLGKTACERG